VPSGFGTRNTFERNWSGLDLQAEITPLSIRSFMEFEVATKSVADILFAIRSLESSFGGELRNGILYPFNNFMMDGGASICFHSSMKNFNRPP